MTRSDAVDAKLQEHLRSEVFGLVIGAAFCAIGGFYFFGSLAGADSAVDRILVWSLRIGAAGFIVCAVLASAGQRHAFLLDAAVCGLVGAVLILTAAAWMIEGVWLGQVFILVVSGAMAIGAALRSWRSHVVWRDVLARTAPPPSSDPWEDSTPTASPPEARPRPLHRQPKPDAAKATPPRVAETKPNKTTPPPVIEPEPEPEP
ncbi:MAG: hypothetical protein JXQ73_07165, partial [Phycisphaerae bacterium]|nr:hypothetical protein [Phycisphaerae bacterium]